MRKAAALLFLILLTFLAPLAGIFSEPGPWYAGLVKPAWNPPAWLFGPVWTFLYLSMAVAAWGVWKKAGWSPALNLWLAQFVLNALWSPLFFGLHQMGLAFAEIVLLWAAVLATFLSFLKVERWAGWLLAPYLAWVSFAAVLNFTLWRLNA